MKTKIIIIDDAIIPEDEAYVFKLGQIYGEENIHIFSNPTEGSQFIKENITKKMIVLLDIMFGKKPLGLDIFKEITDETALVCFIVMTGNIEKLDKKQWLNLVNAHAWYILDRVATTEEILHVIKTANNAISARIDGALEEWILRHERFKREKAYIKHADGKEYSLNDVLSEIRKDTDFGRKMTTNIISTAISMLQNDINKLEKQ